MKKMAFISRHHPTTTQFDMAQAQGFDLVPVGDADAFTVTPKWVHSKGEFEAVAVVHPAAALNLRKEFTVGVFENANRAPEGGRPQFEAVALHVWKK